MKVKKPVLLIAGMLLAGSTIMMPAVSAQTTKTITFLDVTDSGHGKYYFMKNVLIPAFEKKYPTIHVNLISVPFAQFDPKLSALVASGNAPDVWSSWGASGLMDYKVRGLIANLTPYIKKDHWSNPNIPQRLFKTYNFGGKQYAIPVAFFPSFLIYNKTIFKQDHVRFPNYAWGSKQWTWAKMVSLAKKVTRNYGKPNAVYGLNWALGNYDSYGWEFGIDLYTNKNVYQTGYATGNNFGNPKYINAIQQFENLIYKDKVSPTPAITQAIAGTGDAFLTGKVAMETNIGLLLGEAKQTGMQFGIAPIPTGPTGLAPSVLYTAPMMMSSKTQHPNSAMKFIEFFASPEGQKLWVQTTGFPPADQKAAQIWFHSFAKNGVSAQQLEYMTKESIAHGKESPNHTVAGYAQISTFLTNNLQPIFTEDKSPAKVLPTLVNPFNQLLKQIKQQTSLH